MLLLQDSYQSLHKVTHSMAKKTHPKNGSFLIFRLLIVALVVVFLIGLNKTQTSPVVENTNDTEANSKPQANEIILPVALTNQNVTDLYLAYNFFGPIKEVREIDNGKEIVLDTAETDLPRFLITNDTNIFKVNQSDKDRPLFSSVEDLRQGMRVSISTTYDLKTRIWVTRTVHVVD